jgi:hypothetical protein
MGRARNPSLLALELIPKLVPESDDGNVEYKMQLLNPSPSRFARLVTQLKWRLLEGGGQAYYELGVADSGDLVGLCRDEMEKSLETLEMMAGEIGASVIVVKEIEVPATLARLATQRVADKHHESTPSSFSSTEGGDSSNTSVIAFETETDRDSSSGTDADEYFDLEKTVILSKGSRHDEMPAPVFTMESETEDTPHAIEEDEGVPLQPQFDLEISSVFKPRPMKPRGLNPLHGSHLFGGKNKRNKKPIQFNPVQSVKQDFQTRETKRMNKASQRRNRDKLKEPPSTLTMDVPNMSADAVSCSPERDALVDGLKMLHVSVVEELQVVKEGDLEDDNDLFTVKPGLPSLPTFTTSESYLDIDPAAIAGAFNITANDDGKDHKTLIVEALVVRKMLHQEAFLDFGGFSVS